MGDREKGIVGKLGAANLIALLRRKQPTLLPHLMPAIAHLALTGALPFCFLLHLNRSFMSMSSLSLCRGWRKGLVDNGALQLLCLDGELGLSPDDHVRLYCTLTVKHMLTS